METWLCAGMHVCLCVFFNHASLDIEAQFLTWTQISPSLLACFRIPCLCFLFAGIVDELPQPPSGSVSAACPSPGPHTFMASAFYLQSPISRHTKLKLKSRWGSQPTRVFFSCFFWKFSVFLQPENRGNGWKTRQFHRDYAIKAISRTLRGHSGSGNPFVR